MRFSIVDCEIQRPIAEGGMAALFVGRVAGIQRPVALKFPHQHLASDPQFVSMFRAEAILTQSFVHPNIVRTYGACFDSPTPFLVMDLVDGPNLKQFLEARGRPLTAPLALTLFTDVLRGLHTAHEARSGSGERLGVVHRDVTPRNILVDRSGVSKLSDFGVAQSRARSVVANAGTAPYCAPEQLDGSMVDRRTDIYCCAASLWEALTGVRPFSAPRLEFLLSAIRRGAKPRLATIAPWLPRPLIASVEKALALHPDDRFNTAAAFAEALCPQRTERAQSHGRRELAAALEASCPTAASSSEAAQPLTLAAARSRAALRAALGRLQELEAEAHDHQSG